MLILSTPSTHLESDVKTEAHVSPISHGTVSSIAYAAHRRQLQLRLLPAGASASATMPQNGIQRLAFLHYFPCNSI